MDFTFTDYLWLKFGVLVFLAAIWGFWRGFTGQPLELEQHDSTAARDDSKAD